LLGGLAGFGSQIAYDHLTIGVIRWERYLANLGMMLAAFGVFLVVVLTVVGVVQARSNEAERKRPD
jgi:hypothetical protein